MSASKLVFEIGTEEIPAMPLYAATRDSPPLPKPPLTRHASRMAKSSPIRRRAA